MTYLATIALDYSRPHYPNEHTKLRKALTGAGWNKTETSLYVAEHDDLYSFRMALEILARAIETPGTLSACSISLALIDYAQVNPSTALERRQTQRTLDENVLPSEI